MTFLLYSIFKYEICNALIIFKKLFTIMNSNPPGIIKSFFKMQCPRCRSGNMFIEMNAYKLKYIADMPEYCPSCGLSNFPETGFYFGAMYASYMISVFISVIHVLLIWLLFGFYLIPILVFNCLLLLVILPFIYRYARVLWMYVTFAFDPEIYKKVKAV